ncbi:MAG: polysaccharide biosynthesis/export family protein [bacterium]
MKKIIKHIASFLVINIILLSSPIFAVNLDDLKNSGFQIPDVKRAYAAANPASSLPVTSDYVGDAIDVNTYKLGPGDIVSANLIIGEDEMSLDQIFTIEPGGTIYFPKVGAINLLGLSIVEAKKAIDKKIKSGYKEKYVFSFRLIQPRMVNIYATGDSAQPVFMGEKKYVSVYGEVNKVGRFEYLPGKKLSDYISFAGGPSPKALLGSVTIARQANGKPDKKYINASRIIYDGDSKNDVEILGGDVINVPGNFFYFSDFAGFVNTIMLGLTLYSVIKK